MRAGKVKKRQIDADPIYKSRLVTRITSVIMRDGKKSLAEKTIHSALNRLSTERKTALLSFEQAVKNVMPVQEVRSRRIGGATYQIPTPVKHDRSEALAIRWIVNAARSKRGKPMEVKLYEELKQAMERTGAAVKKKEDVHRMAEANRAFAHFKF